MVEADETYMLRWEKGSQLEYMLPFGVIAQARGSNGMQRRLYRRTRR